MKYIYFPKFRFLDNRHYGFEFAAVCNDTYKYLSSWVFIPVSKVKPITIRNSDESLSYKAYRVLKDDFEACADEACRKKEEEWKSKGTYGVHLEPFVPASFYSYNAVVNSKLNIEWNTF